MTTATKPRKRVKPERRATLGTMTNGKMVLWITQDGETRGYLLTPLASDFGTAYQLLKADNGDSQTEKYDVLLNGREISCTCPGHTYRHKCKHVDALLALVRAGKLCVPEPEQQPSEVCAFDDP
jgi:hypothetical protein